jgi:hypothetical protein
LSADIAQGGRATILASATGEESFVDVNGDGLYTAASDTFVSGQGEPFLDADESGVYNAGEIYIDSSSLGTIGSYDTAAGLDGGADIFTGLGCSQADVDNVLCTNSTLSIFGNIVLNLAPQDAVNYFAALVAGGAGGNRVQSVGDADASSVTSILAAGFYQVYVSDRYNLQPASGATVTIATTGSCAVSGVTQFTVPNSARDHAFSADVNVTAVGTNGSGDTLSITVQNPNGTSRQWSYVCEAP